MRPHFYSSVAKFPIMFEKLLEHLFFAIIANQQINSAHKRKSYCCYMKLNVCNMCANMEPEIVMWSFDCIENQYVAILWTLNGGI